MKTIKEYWVRTSMTRKQKALLKEDVLKLIDKIDVGHGLIAIKELKARIKG